jgi:DNA-binding NarL/FixJ family response regulator
MRVDDVLIPSTAGVSACPPVIIVVYRSDDASRVRSDSGSVGFNAPLRREPEAELFPALTPREREVLQLILEGFPNKNIAADLQISMRTVENHRASIMKKTGSKSLAALVRFAMRAGDMQASPSQVRQ